MRLIVRKKRTVQFFFRPLDFERRHTRKTGKMSVIPFDENHFRFL